MIRFIAAIDSKRGMANEHGIPWQGKLPREVAYFRDKTITSTILMGYGTYTEFDKPLADRRNLVATTKDSQLRSGFEPVTDARQFLRDAVEDVWVIGGANLFAQTLDLADELYITQLEGDFDCTKFFPEFENEFTLVSKSESQQENDIHYQFEVWSKD